MRLADLLGMSAAARAGAGCGVPSAYLRARDVIDASTPAPMSELAVGYLPRQNEDLCASILVSDRSADQIMWVALGLLLMTSALSREVIGTSMPCRISGPNQRADLVQGYLASRRGGAACSTSCTAHRWY